VIRRSVGEGATVVLSSHELDRAEALAHRTVTIAGGTVQPTVPSDERGVGREVVHAP
jgi:ABC-type multidrug transport system ATPase subunit